VNALALAILAVAVVLAVSGAAKVSARQQTEDAFEALRIPLVPRALGAAVLPWGEIALALALLVLRGPALVVAAVAALVLCLAYTVVIGRARGFAEPVTCSCFGKFGAAKVSTTTLWRNIVLSALALLALAGAATGQHVWSLVTEHPGWVVVAALVAALFALIAAGSGTPTTSAGSGFAAGSAAVDPESEDVGEELDYERHPIPYAQLRTPEDTVTTLRDLARTQARLLLFLSAGCGSCRRTAERIDGWAEQLAPAVSIVPIYAHAPGQVEFAVPFYIQPDYNASQVLEAHGTPAAVLLGADGMLAGGPIAGEDSVRRFVEEILEQIHGAPEVTELLESDIVEGTVV